MKIQLISNPNENLSIVEQIMINRGIPLSEIKHYLNTTDEDINSPLLFGEEIMKNAADAVFKCIELKKRMLVLVDADADGYTSAAIFINYLYDLFPDYVNSNVDWFLHSGKQHGLSDLETDIQYGLIVVPDAGSNDIEYHKKYAALGTRIVILDHHEAELVPTPAIIINNQMSGYPNKALSGAGVTWQFCRYLDSLKDTEYAGKYLDLVALGLVADMMDLRSIETRHLVTQGFKSENIINPFISGMTEKNAFTIGSKLTPIGAAFYIAPFVNAMVRSGTAEEKELLFQSMLNFKANEKILSNKRGHKPGEMETLITQALRTVTNVKNRQTKTETTAMEGLEATIERDNLLQHKVLLFLLSSKMIDKNVAGLIANRLMAKYQRPCCVLTKTIGIDEQGRQKISYQGSARGCGLAGINNFKDICENTGVVEYAQGHQNAFGLSLPESEISAFLAYTDNALKDISNEPVYYVDYLYYNADFAGRDVLDIAYLSDLWGQNVDEPYVAIQRLKVTKDMVVVYEKKDLTLKITLSNKVALIMFKAPKELCEKLTQQTGYYTLDIVARAAANEYSGNVSPQLKIVDWEITGQSQWDF